MLAGDRATLMLAGTAREEQEIDKYSKFLYFYHNAV
jgi:hypothetical protein